MTQLCLASNHVGLERCSSCLQMAQRTWMSRQKMRATQTCKAATMSREERMQTSLKLRCAAGAAGAVWAGQPMFACSSRAHHAAFRVEGHINGS